MGKRKETSGIGRRKEVGSEAAKVRGDGERGGGVEGQNEKVGMGRIGDVREKKDREEEGWKGVDVCFSKIGRDHEGRKEDEG